jgi:hypothetical protein
MSWGNRGTGDLTTHGFRASGDVKFESIHGLGRLYQITATIDPDGKATLVWKLRKDRP